MPARTRDYQSQGKCFPQSLQAVLSRGAKPWSRGSGARAGCGRQLNRSTKSTLDSALNPSHARLAGVPKSTSPRRAAAISAHECGSCAQIATAQWQAQAWRAREHGSADGRAASAWACARGHVQAAHAFRATGGLRAMRSAAGLLASGPVARGRKLAHQLQFGLDLARVVLERRLFLWPRRHRGLPRRLELPPRRVRDLLGARPRATGRPRGPRHEPSA